MRTVTIQRLGGLGDVCMALCAAHAVKAAGAEVNFITAPCYADLARACPHVDRVLDPGEDSRGEFYDLGPAFHGLAQEHQVISFCRTLGIQNPSLFDLSLDLGGPATKFRVSHMSGGMVLLHPGITDQNRTVPAALWDALVAMLNREGIPVGVIGQSVNPDHRSVFRPAGNIVDLTDAFTHLELVDFFRSFDPRKLVLVSTDSGPIQLAGATRAGIVGFYSVAPGRWRLPYRNGSTHWRTMEIVPECVSAPCYSKLGYAEIEAGTKAGLSLGEIFGRWCPEDRSNCFSGVRVDRIVSGIKEFMA